MAIRTSVCSTSPKASIIVLMAGLTTATATAPTASGTRRSFENTRLTNSGAPIAIGNREAQPRAQCQRRDQYHHGGGRQEAEPIDGDDIEEQQRRRHQRLQAAPPGRRRTGRAGLAGDPAGDARRDRPRPPPRSGGRCRARSWRHRQRGRCRPPAETHWGRSAGRAPAAGASRHRPRGRPARP